MKFKKSISHLGNAYVTCEWCLSDAKVTIFSKNQTANEAKVTFK